MSQRHEQLRHDINKTNTEVIGAAREVRRAFSDWGLEGYYDFEAMVAMERSRKAALTRLDEAVAAYDKASLDGVNTLLTMAAESIDRAEAESIKQDEEMEVNHA